MDKQTEGQIAELKMMREAYRLHNYRRIVAEQIGETTLIMLNRKPTLWGKIFKGGK